MPSALETFNGSCCSLVAAISTAVKTTTLQINNCYDAYTYFTGMEVTMISQHHAKCPMNISIKCSLPKLSLMHMHLMICIEPWNNLTRLLTYLITYLLTNIQPGHVPRSGHCSFMITLLPKDQCTPKSSFTGNI